MLTLPTASDNRRGVPPPPDHNLVGLEGIIPVFRENQVRIIATFNLELNVFLLSDKSVEVVYVMIFVHGWQVNAEAGGCDVKHGKSRFKGVFPASSAEKSRVLPESPSSAGKPRVVAIDTGISFNDKTRINMRDIKIKPACSSYQCNDL